MDKFKQELEKAKNPWIKRIGNYLLSREDVHENLKKQDKSLQKCFDYILIELSKKCTREGNIGYISGDDEEIYSLAVHYYDEDDIVVSKKGFRTNADGTADAKMLSKKIENKKKNQKKEQKAEEKTAKKTTKKVKKSNKIAEGQLSIFDAEVMGND